MKVKNQAGFPIELFWKDMFKGPADDPPLVLQTTKPIRNGSDAAINSYDTHEFLVRVYRPEGYTGTEEAAEGSFVKGPREEDIFVTYNASTHSLDVRQMTKFDQMMEKITKATDECNKHKGKSSKSGQGNKSGDDDNYLSRCIAEAVLSDVQRLADSKSDLKASRDTISSRLRNYTCDDETLETTKAINSYVTTINNKQIHVDTLYDTPAAKIWVAHDFITPEECDILTQHGLPRLKRATVAAEDGSSIVSEHRKAQQANYDVHETLDADPLYDLYERVFHLTNHHAGFNLWIDGQEDFTIIQYNVADQYTPHCDGTCDGSMHTPHGRVASAVLYCKVAEKGGGTTFTKSDVFVKPTPGMATFFSYKGLDGRMDEGYTEHSGCPVLEGEKWITTVWMREGVSYEEPWTLFDPDGLRLMEDEPEDPSRLPSGSVGGEYEEEVNYEGEEEL